MTSCCWEKVNENCGSRRKYQVANPPKRVANNPGPGPQRRLTAATTRKKNMYGARSAITAYIAKRIANAQMTRRSVKPYCFNTGQSCSFCQSIRCSFMKASETKKATAIPRHHSIFAHQTSAKGSRSTEFPCSRQVRSYPIATDQQTCEWPFSARSGRSPTAA